MNYYNVATEITSTSHCINHKTYITTIEPITYNCILLVATDINLVNHCIAYLMVTY